MGYRRIRETSICYQKPREYKFCLNGDCILNNDYCPCFNPQFFQCSNGKCLDPSVVCNGQNDCRDNTDERNCFEPGVYRTLSVGAIIAICVGVLFLVAICAIVIILCTHRRKRLKQQQSNSVTEPLRSSVRNSSEVNTTSGSEGNIKNGYDKVPLEESFGPFDDVLCTSTPKPEARKHVLEMTSKGGPNKPLFILKVV